MNKKDIVSAQKLDKTGKNAHFWPWKRIQNNLVLFLWDQNWWQKSPFLALNMDNNVLFLLFSSLTYIIIIGISCRNLTSNMERKVSPGSNSPHLKAKFC